MKCIRGTTINLSYGLYPSPDDEKFSVVPTAEFIIITTEPKYGIKTGPDGERAMTKNESIDTIRLSLTVNNIKKLVGALIEAGESLESMSKLKLTPDEGIPRTASELATPVTTDGIPSTNEPGDSIDDA